MSRVQSRRSRIGRLRTALSLRARSRRLIRSMLLSAYPASPSSIGEINGIIEGRILASVVVLLVGGLLRGIPGLARILGMLLEGLGGEVPLKPIIWSADEGPRVLISILSWDAPHYVGRLLRDLKENLPGNCAHHIRILDQGSRNRTRRLVNRFMRRIPHATASLSSRNIGFSAGHNSNYDEVWRRSHFDYFVVLNSDVIFRKAGWLDTLLIFMETHASVAVAGPSAYCIRRESGELRGHGRPADPQEIGAGLWDFVSGAISILRTRTIRRLGLFDTTYTPGYFEDSDLCLRYARYGEKHAIVPDCPFEHRYLKGRPSSVGAHRRNLDERFGDFMERNRNEFLERWLDSDSWPREPEALAQTHPLIYFPPEALDADCWIQGPGKGTRDGFSYDIGLKSRLVVHHSTRIRPGAHFEIHDGGEVRIGAGCVIGMFNWVQGNGGVEIGANTITGPHVCLLSTQHGIESGHLIRSQPLHRKKLTLGRDVFIGANATICAGISILDGAVVGSNSYVGSDVAPLAIVGGVPARRIGERRQAAYQRSALAVVAVGNSDRPDRFDFQTNLFGTIGVGLANLGVDLHLVCHPDAPGNPSRIAPGHQIFREDHADFEALLDRFDPAWLFVWNGGSDGDRITQKHAAQHGIPVVYAELGWFPQATTFYFDPCGTNARSEIRNLDLTGVEIDPRLDSWVARYLAEMGWGPVDPGEYVFVPLQDERDLNITLASPYETMAEFVDALSLRFPDKRFVVRPHPRFPDVVLNERPNVDVRSGGGLYGWLRGARSVVGINSTILLESLLMGKPTFSVGAGLATGLDVMFEAASVENLDLDRRSDSSREERRKRFLSELIFRRQLDRSRAGDPQYLLESMVVGGLLKRALED